MNKIFVTVSLLFLLIKINAQDKATDSLKHVVSYPENNANKEIDSLKQLLATAKEDTNKIQLLYSLSSEYTWSKPDSAIVYGIPALLLSKRLHYTDGELMVTSVLSEALCAKGNFSKALEIDLEAVQLSKKEGKKDIFDDYWIGNVYFYSGDYSKALQVYTKYPSNKIVDGVMGEAYYHLNQLDSADFYIRKSYLFDKKDSAHWSVPYYYMALLESRKGKFTDALDNYRTGLLFAKNIDVDIANGYNGIAMVFKQMGQPDSAIYYACKAMVLAKKESLIPNMLDASALLTEVYIKINKDSAFKYQSIMLAAKDSLFSEEKVKQLQNLSFNEQVRQQELQQAVQQNQLKYKNRLNVYIFLAGLFILLTVILGLWRRNIFRKKSLLLLQQKNEQIESTLTQLKATQSQLIQSEKMASLGELTAGIAHEIQNPLNFVNNFSEINKELVDELQTELKAGNTEEAIAISNDIKDNEEKINHHGKRADSIVKGMLQHTRTSSGQKELTDINKLADEYLRLAYYGLRAKDKSFNAALITNYDETVGSINIVAQDIARVLLNIYNNAFYAVNEKAKQQLTNYEPSITVTTKRINDKVEIIIRDNGNGISQKVVDKIFQPFFTTKPTGQGTGLGLSLSYDIIKAHGGEIKVNTKEGEYTEFIITI